MLSGVRIIHFGSKNVLKKSLGIAAVIVANAVWCLVKQSRVPKK